MSKKIMKSAAIFATMALVSVPMIAQPIQQKIDAMINPTVEYTLNGEDILDDTTTITYNNKNYVSVADLSKALGLDVKFENGTVVLTEKAVDSRTVETTEENTEVAPEFVEVLGATVVAIDEEAGQVTILPAGMEDDVNNYLVLNVSEETVVSEDLEVGDVVNVKRSPMMTFSLPPQSPAFEITVVTESEAVLPEVVEIPNATIKEINLETRQVTVLPAGMEDEVLNYVVLNTSDDATVVRHEFNKMAYRLEDLEEGMKVSAKHKPIMTLSIPAQVPTLEIVILQDQQ